MSYDLAFWRYKGNASQDNSSVYSELLDGNHVDGLDTLPIEAIMARIRNEFSEGWDQLDDFTWEGDSAILQVYVTDQLFVAHCYGLEVDDLNTIIGVLNEFDCPLFDPQAGHRFDG